MQHKITKTYACRKHTNNSKKQRAIIIKPGIILAKNRILSFSPYIDNTNMPMMIHNKCPAIIFANILTEREITLNTYEINSTFIINMLKLLGIPGGKKKRIALELYNSKAIYCIPKNAASEMINTKQAWLVKATLYG